jgi:DNA polymerase III delta subunit
MLYLIKGDETLLLEEAIEDILKKSNHPNKKIFDIVDNKTFDAALQELKSPDMFNIDPVYIFKISDKAYKTIGKKLNLLPKDTRTIIITSVNLKQFPQWLEKLFQKAGFQINAVQKDLLCTYLEGNILAAKQCIEKLKLCYPAESGLTEKQLLDILTPSAKYTIFDLINHLSVTQLHKISVILKSLYEEGVDPAIILWSLARESRRRQTQEALPALMEVDNMIKGTCGGNIFQALERAAFAIIGKMIP